MKFVGKLAGDGESFGWSLARDEYIRVFGQEAYDAHTNEFSSFGGQKVPPQKFILVYPEEILALAGAEDDEVYEFEITARKQP